jgi:hypothetical protein
MPHAFSLAKTAIPTLTTKAFSRHARTVGRVLLGLVFFTFGLNYFLDFLPPPSGPIPEGAAALAFAFMKAGYMFPLIKGTEVLAGALLLANRFVPLALALIAPVIVNIVAFHAFLAPSGLGLALGLVAVEVALAWGYRKAFRGLVAARAE